MSQLVHIACDHAGLNLKNVIIEHLEAQGHNVKNHGTNEHASCDYPIFAKALCAGIKKQGGVGILICGTGIGMSIMANRIKGIRAALCNNEFQARATRAHNDANVLCLGERTIGQGVALDIVDIFMNTPFEGGRHEKRIALFEQTD